MAAKGFVIETCIFPLADVLDLIIISWSELSKSSPRLQYLVKR